MTRLRNAKMVYVQDSRTTWLAGNDPDTTFMTSDPERISRNSTNSTFCKVQDNPDA